MTAYGFMRWEHLSELANPVCYGKEETEENTSSMLGKKKRHLNYLISWKTETIWTILIFFRRSLVLENICKAKGQYDLQLSFLFFFSLKLTSSVFFSEGEGGGKEDDLSLSDVPWSLHKLLFSH